MPAIPTYQQRTSVGGAGLGPGPMSSSPTGIIGQAIGRVGDDLLQAEHFKHQQAVQAQHEQDELALIDANATEMNVRSKWAQQMLERKQAAQPGADGFVPQVLNDYDAETADTLKGVTNKKARAYLQNRFADVRLSLQNDAMSFESASRGQVKKSRLEDATSAAMTAARIRPQDFESILMAQQGTMENFGLTDAEKAAAIPQARSNIASAAVEGLIEQDPYKTLKELRNENSIVLAVKSLDYGDRDKLINAAEVRINHLEAKRAAAIAKNDAKAVHALNEIDRQIASGVPATPEMWSDWGNKIKGTEYEQDFNDRVSDERDVQKMLRLPIDQQIKYVQDKQSDLTTNGGTVRDATNLQRLTTAVQQNVKLMQESPLQFNANRLGETVEPLEVQQVVSGEASAQLQDRMTTLSAMRKEYGSQVPQRLLLPQEAKELSSVLQTATPKQQSEVFSSLYRSVGDSNAFKSVMQQIAPDAPVKAIAGMLAANQAQMTTATHWFKPDEIKFSGDVSATLLQGESMLNASKEDKATNGKPNAKLYLPEQTTLQSAFQDRVGNAFVGRPEAADVAMQAVKAYYVGRAAQTGRLAANSKDIDQNLVKEAITATLGTVVDYNGNGEVFAPWGMNRSDFINKAQAAMVAAGRAQGLGDNQLNAFGNAGLRNKGDNTYYVVQGRNYMYGNDGKPIIVTVQP